MMFTKFRDIWNDIYFTIEYLQFYLTGFSGDQAVEVAVQSTVAKTEQWSSVTVVDVRSMAVSNDCSK